MKLLNPTDRVIFLRDEVNRKLIVLKPGELIDVSYTQREVFSKYVQGFQLRWILDDDDLPPALRGSSDERQGTLQYYRKHEQKDDGADGFDAAKALAQSDSEEIANVWKEHDTVRYIPHVSTTKPITPGSPEDFLFFKEGSTTETQEGKVIQEISPLTREEFDTILTAGEREDGYEDTSVFEAETVGTDVRSYNENDEGDELPSTAPVTLNQLNMSTKAQLFEMCDKLGLDASGTKKYLIENIVKYYQNVHLLNISKGTTGRIV